MLIRLNPNGSADIFGKTITRDQAEILNCLIMLHEPIPSLGMGRFLTRLATEPDIGKELEALRQFGFVQRHKRKVRMNGELYERNFWSAADEVKLHFHKLEGSNDVQSV